LISLGLPLLALAAALQSSLLPQLTGRAVPGLVFLLVVCWAIDTDWQQGVVWAFIGGIMLDLLSSLPIGTSTIPLLVLAFPLGGVGEQIYRLRLPLLLGVGFFGTLAQQLLMLILIALLGHRVGWLQNFSSIILPTMFYNVLLILPVSWFLNRLQRGFRRSGK
jgi:rod shape-determining protein MreD